VRFNRFPGLRNRTQGILQVQLLPRVISILLDFPLANGNLLVGDLELLSNFSFPIGVHIDTSFKEFPISLDDPDSCKQVK
jgi:hypothetical protein